MLSAVEVDPITRHLELYSSQPGRADLLLVMGTRLSDPAYV
jgi:hypothetical protein